MSEQVVRETLLAAEGEELVNKMADVRKAISLLLPAFKEDWNQWTRESGNALTEVRQWRMAFSNEMHQALTKFKDLRQFFLCVEHTEEMARLKEFVEVCERLKTLKESGFLDSVADTILRLGVKQ